MELEVNVNVTGGCYHIFDSNRQREVGMQSVRPASDPRNKFAGISEDVRESGRSVVLTCSGHGDMVVMSIESFEELSFHSEVLAALRDAEREAAVTEERFSPDEVLAEARAAVASSVAVGPDRV